MIGKTIGHYRIESKVGEGGMGVVYRAVDTRLDRLVALKVLQPDTLPDIEHKRRFVQEARAASALNHPNIVTIYEIGRAEDVEFIAMEYVPGHALDKLIARGPMALPEVLRCAIEIADALGKAHAAGIIHRDLKPANVMLTPDGSVKLLDFGLAKHIEIGSSEAQTATHPSPAQTQKGIVIGTLGYMSPEQAQGKPLDARSDIFSFGALVYELVTGRSAFFADTQLATLSAILHDEPKPITDFVRTVPQELERIIRRCLRKDPNRRFHHILDVKVALQELNEEAASRNIDNAKVTHSIAWPWRWILPVVGIALFAVAAAFWLGRRERTAPLAPVVTRLTSDSGLTTQPALSSDGKLVAYASDRSKDGNLDIWVQQVPSGEAIQLTRDPADDSDPDFAPDGQRIVFRSERNGGGIYVISSLGGAERLIAPRGQGPRFSPDGTKIAYWVGARGGYTASEIRVVNASGGPERPLQIGTAFAQTPVWSPDGKYLLFLGARDASVAGQGDWDWWVYGLDEGQSIRTGVKPFLQQMGISRFREPGIWLPGGRIVFSAALGDSTNLWELSLSKGTWQVEGTPQRVTTGAGPELHPAAGGKGQIVFANEVENLDVWWLPVEASAGIVPGDAQRATEGASSESTAIISADGSRLTFISDRSGNDDVWMKDLRSGSETAVTMTPSNESSVATDRNGARIAYNRVEDRQSRIYVVSAAQPGVPDKVCDDCGLLDASSDGTRLLYTPSPVEARISTIHLLNLSSGEKMRLLEHPIHTLFSARFSHDGSWVSFHEFTGLASRRIYVARLRGTASIPAQEWVPITDGTGLDRDACWAPDGNLLYFFSERDGFRCIWAQRLDPQTKRPVGEVVPVYHMHHARRSIRTFDNLAVARLSTAPAKLVFSMGEYTGNIWMQSPQQR